VSTLTAVFTLATLGSVLAGCGKTRPPTLDAPAPSAVASGPTSPEDQLAALAATALDRTYVAGYTYHVPGQADRIVVVAVASDDSWSVNVPKGALDGGADVSIVSENKAGMYQCVLGGPATTLAPLPSPGPSAPPSPDPSTPPAPSLFPAPACVKVAGAGKNLPAKVDPQVEHPFRLWLQVLAGKDAPISVFAASPLSRTAGTCYSVEPSAASLAPVVDAGIFCFRPDGTVTEVKLASGTLTLTGNQGAPPATTPLPAPVTSGPAAPVHAQARS